MSLAGLTFLLVENAWVLSLGAGPAGTSYVMLLGRNVRPSWLSGKESTCQCGVARDAGLISGLGRSLGVGNGNPLQCSCLENSMDRGAWRATVHGAAESDMTEHTQQQRPVWPPFLLQLPRTPAVPRSFSQTTGPEGTSRMRTWGAVSLHQSNGRPAGLVRLAPV